MVTINFYMSLGAQPMDISLSRSYKLEGLFHTCILFQTIKTYRSNTIVIQVSGDKNNVLVC
jgi:hypothetical protein